ncbi:MAG: hypothetical protein F6K48_14910 [Okeania sp. SIO3H1]|nr:hypothetical protein [Okeania sp. SIO3H1]
MYKSAKCMAIENYIERLFKSSFHWIDWRITASNIGERQDSYLIFIDCKISYSFLNILKIVILRQVNIFRLPYRSFELKYFKYQSLHDIKQDIYDKINDGLKSMNLDIIKEEYK